MHLPGGSNVCAGLSMVLRSAWFKALAPIHSLRQLGTGGGELVPEPVFVECEPREGRQDAITPPKRFASAIFTHLRLDLSSLLSEVSFTVIARADRDHVRHAIRAIIRQRQNMMTF